MGGWYRAAGLSEYQARLPTVRKTCDVSHNWHRTKAMAFTKDGDGLSYQAALLSKKCVKSS